MREKLALLIILFNSIIFAQYKIDNGRIFFQEGKYQKQLVIRRVENEDKYRNSGSYKKELPDLKSFKIINSEYAIDKYTAYFQEKDIQDSDIMTFEVLNNGIAKDKNYVYLHGEKIRYKTGKPINLKDFILLEKDGTFFYLKDKSGIYKLGMYIEKLENIDENTFEVLKNGCGKDKNSVYYEAYKLENVDKETFECLESGFAKDKNGVYGGGVFLASIEKGTYNIEKIENIDKSTFEIVGETYLGTVIKDKNGVYYPNLKTYKYEKIKEIDSKTFEIIDNFFSKDKNNLYFLSEKLENIEKEEIETAYVGKKNNVVYSVFFKNKNGVYRIILEDSFDFSKKKLTKLNTDKNTFEVMSRDYYKDKNNVYCNDKIIKEADAESFETIEDEDREMLKFVDGLMEIFGQGIEKNENITVKDKNNKYINCEVIK